MGDQYNKYHVRVANNVLKFLMFWMLFINQSILLDKEIQTEFNKEATIKQQLWRIRRELSKR